MRKALRILMLVVLGVILTLSSVNATNLTETISATDGLGGIIKFQKSYDAENDVSELLVELTITETSINKILNQAPGNSNSAASLGTFYFTLNPGLTGSSFSKDNYWFAKDTNVKTAIETIKARVDATNSVTYDDVWPPSIYVQYFDSTTSKWLPVTETSNGGKTIKANLMEKLGLSNESELKYGENYRLFMYENYYWLYGWKIDGTDYEYVKVSYKINFPIVANVDAGNVYYPTLESALTSESKDIVINEDITLNNNVTIPEGVTVTVAEGVTLEVADGVEITNNGTILGAIKQNGATEVYHSVSITEPKNASVSLEKNSYVASTEVAIVVNPELGYKVSSIEILDEAESDITSSVNYNDTTKTFTMPNEDVQVVVTTEAISYQFIEGTKATYENKDLVFKLDGPLQLFSKVYVNNTELPQESYSLASDNTIITLKNEYLSTLDANTYNLKVEFSNGTSDETTFTVAQVPAEQQPEEEKPVEQQPEEEKPAEQQPEEENPNTSDGIITYVILGIVSTLALLGSVVYINKNKKNNK